MIAFDCSNGGKSMRVSDKSGGKRVRCPACGQGTRVPAGQGGSEKENAEIIKFRCEHCDQKIGVPAGYAGRQVRCAKCKEPIRVGQSSRRT